MINGALKLGPALQNIILCEASRLKINTRDRFMRRVAEMLKSVPQPPSRNDVIQATRSVLRDIPTSDVLISHSTTTAGDEYDNYELRRRY